MKKLIKTLLLIAWMILIYSFSAQNASASSGLSSLLLRKIGEIINSVKEIDIDVFIKNFSFIFRKGAHFFEYFILFILSYECLKEYKIKNLIIISLLFCLIYAGFDEFHQLFVDGRSGQISDVLIDFGGSFISNVFWHHLFKK